MTTNNNYQQANNSHSDSSFSKEQQFLFLEAFKAVVQQEGAAAKDYQAAYQSLDLEVEKGQENYLYGIVIELGQPKGGYDLLTVYQNYSASYKDATGKIFLWERPDGEFDALMDEVLEAGKGLLPNMPIWDNDFLKPVQSQNVRIHLLTSKGMYSAEAATEEMSTSPLGEEMMQVSKKLMSWLAYYYENNLHL